MEQEYFHLKVLSSVGLLIPITETVEVITCQREEICPIPGVVFPLKGVLNQRGRLLWIVGLAELLGLPNSESQKHPQDQLTVVVVSQSKMNLRFGGIVSHLEGMVSLEEQAIRPVPHNYRRQAHLLLNGITKINNQKAAILNVSNVFQHLQQSSIASRSMVSL